MYCLNMLSIALELASERTITKTWPRSSGALRADRVGDQQLGLWNEEDGFYYDLLHRPDGSELCLKIRSMVGLIPLFAWIPSIGCPTES